MNRILIGAVVGGLVVFFWGAVSHMVLPTGDFGIKTIPNEDALIRTMQDFIHEPGFYFFPGSGMGSEATETERKAWEEKYKTGPAGILVYHPDGMEPMSAKLLLTELATNILAALLAALILSQIAAPFVVRIVLVGLLGLFSWLSISVSYWNWYGFPTTFVVSEAIDQVVGWLLAGVVLAFIVKRRKS